MDFHPTNPLPKRHDSSNQLLIRQYFNLETEFMAATGYHLQEKFIRIRSMALSDIEKYVDNEVDLTVIFHAIGFIDRFLSRNADIPVVKWGEGFESNLKLFVCCCISIASKINCSKFSYRKFMYKHEVGFPREVLVMELQILQGLQWRIRPLTSITFANILLPLVRAKNQPEWLLLIRALSRVVYSIQRDIQFTEFRPSTLAASAILVTSYKVLPTLHPGTAQEVHKCGFIQKLEVKKCLIELKKHDIVDYILKPDKDPLKFFKERFRQKCWRRKQKEVIIDEPVPPGEIVEVKEEFEQKLEITVEEPIPKLEQPVHERWYNTFPQILISCFFPMLFSCFGLEEIVTRERPN